jgi:hypothetical protein
MAVQFISDPIFDRGTFPLTAPNRSRLSQGEEWLAHADAKEQERERRRIEFRASLMKARAAFGFGAGARCLPSQS